MEVFTLIARKKNVALVFVSYLLVALAAISLLTICIGFAPGILFAVVFGLIAYLMIMAQNTEFEYSYFDGELRFAKIKNKSRRKRLGIYSMESVAAIAPAGDRSVYNYENGNEIKKRSNYSSPSKWYILDFVLPASYPVEYPLLPFNSLRHLGQRVPKVTGAPHRWQ